MTKRDERKLRQEIRETRLMVEGVLALLQGRDQTRTFVAAVRRHLEGDALDVDQPIWGLGLEGSCVPLMEADLQTLGEIADRPRAEIAALSGVGRTSMKKIDLALEGRGMSWPSAEREAVGA